MGLLLHKFFLPSLCAAVLLAYFSHEQEHGEETEEEEEEEEEEDQACLSSMRRHAGSSWTMMTTRTIIFIMLLPDIITASPLESIASTNSYDLHTLGLNAYKEGRHEEAVHFIEKAVFLSPDDFNFRNTLGEFLREKEDWTAAVEQYTHALAVTEGIEPNMIALVWNNLGKTYIAQNMYERAEQTYKESLRINPHNNVEARFKLFLTIHMNGRLDEAFEGYTQLLPLLETAAAFIKSPMHLGTILNMGIIETLRGNSENGMELFKKVLELDPNNSNALNNLGSMTSIFDSDTAKIYLKRAAIVNPNDFAPHVNLAAICYADGDIVCASKEYQDALNLGGYPALQVRRATLMEPIMGNNWSEIHAVRTKFQSEMKHLFLEWQLKDTRITSDPTQAVQWLHYYPLYHGLSEYKNQVMMATFYSSMVNNLQWVAPHLTSKEKEEDVPTPTPTLEIPKKKIKIGFMSKFFGVGQPHGLLLEGVIRHLPRDLYDVIVFVVPGTKSSLTPELRASADLVVKLQLVLPSVQRTLASHKLDVLVLADGMSEPINYFIAIGTRVAPVQCMFWGNPVTTGATNIDYFISGDRLESNEGWKEYSEQLIRLEGQAIWYTKFIAAPPAQQSNKEKWSWHTGNTTVYICPQSAYKIHPDFIETIGNILTQVPNSHLVLLQARKQGWTEMLQNRMIYKLTTEVYERIHFVPRTDSASFLQLIGSADIMLHPFPFGGSKTSADGIAAGLPVVCMKTNYLRGRMAYSFFVTMEYEVTVANNQQEYIDIAVKLGIDVDFRQTVALEIQSRSHLIWERHEYIQSWNTFLQRATANIVSIYSCHYLMRDEDCLKI